MSQEQVTCRLWSVIDRVTFIDYELAVVEDTESDFAVIFDTMGLEELRIWCLLQNFYLYTIFRTVLTILPLIAARYLSITVFSIFTNFFKFDFIHERFSCVYKWRRYLFCYQFRQSATARPSLKFIYTERFKGKYTPQTITLSRTTAFVCWIITLLSVNPCCVGERYANVCHFLIASAWQASQIFCVNNSLAA